MYRSTFKRDVREKYTNHFRQLFAYFNLMINSFCKIHQCHDFQPQKLYGLESDIMNIVRINKTI